MEKLFLLMLMLTSSTTVSFAANNCSVIEYSELKEMDKGEIVKEYCFVKKEAKRLLDREPDEMQMLRMREIGNCYEQEKRISRVIKSRFKKLPECKQ